MERVFAHPLILNIAALGCVDRTLGRSKLILFRITSTLPNIPDSQEKKKKRPRKKGVIHHSFPNFSFNTNRKIIFIFIMAHEKITKQEIHQVWPSKCRYLKVSSIRTTYVPFSFFFFNFCHFLAALRAFFVSSITLTLSGKMHT